MKTADNKQDSDKRSEEQSGIGSGQEESGGPFYK